MTCWNSFLLTHESVQNPQKTIVTHLIVWDVEACKHLVMAEHLRPTGSYPASKYLFEDISALFSSFGILSVVLCLFTSSSLALSSWSFTFSSREHQIGTSARASEWISALFCGITVSSDSFTISSGFAGWLTAGVCSDMHLRTLGSRGWGWMGGSSLGRSNIWGAASLRLTLGLSREVKAISFWLREWQRWEEWDRRKIVTNKEINNLVFSKNFRKFIYSFSWEWYRWCNSTEVQFCG